MLLSKPFLNARQTMARAIVLLEQDMQLRASGFAACGVCPQPALATTRCREKQRRAVCQGFREVHCSTECRALYDPGDLTGRA